ncbi:hypothetical protein [Streptomyces nodosus]|uniref:hypothetical protein n=1 Tax=Streptomyces nodosus TaxID=40318 RepID=UPI0037FB85D8
MTDFLSSSGRYTRLCALLIPVAVMSAARAAGQLLERLRDAQRSAPATGPPRARPGETRARFVRADPVGR